MWIAASIVAVFVLYALPPWLLWAVFVVACLFFLGLSCRAYKLIYRDRSADAIFLH